MKTRDVLTLVWAATIMLFGLFVYATAEAQERYCSDGTGHSMFVSRGTNTVICDLLNGKEKPFAAADCDAAAVLNLLEQNVRDIYPLADKNLDGVLERTWYLHSVRAELYRDIVNGRPGDPKSGTWAITFSTVCTYPKGYTANLPTPTPIPTTTETPPDTVSIEPTERVPLILNPATQRLEVKPHHLDEKGCVAFSNEGGNPNLHALNGLPGYRWGASMTVDLDNLYYYMSLAYAAPTFHGHEFAYEYGSKVRPVRENGMQSMTVEYGIEYKMICLEPGPFAEDDDDWTLEVYRTEERE